MREIVERKRGRWYECAACQVAVMLLFKPDAEPGDPPILYGPCRCPGWTPTDQPELARIMLYGLCPAVAPEGSACWGSRCRLPVGHDGAHIYGDPQRS